MGWGVEAGMTRVTRAAHWSVAGLLLLLTGCSSTLHHEPTFPAGSIRLVAFASCDDLLNGVRTAAKAAVGPYGFGNNGLAIEGDRRAVAPGAQTAVDNAAGAKAAAPDSAPQNDYSGTNTNEPGVDEPDLVKTDGKRIVTLQGGVLRVVDVASKRVTGMLPLTDAAGYVSAGATELLLSGDHVLVLVPGGYGNPMPMRTGFAPAGAPSTATPVRPDPVGPQLLLVDLAGGPHLVGQYTVDGGLVDARQVGATVRVVVRSGPRITFGYDPSRANEAQRIAANQATIDQAALTDWLPRYAYDDATGHHTGQVDCTAVSRPSVYTGASMLTVLTFDLARPGLGSGDPISLVADGETVYSNGPSLYVAGYPDYATPRMPARTSTELYKFDTSQPGRPAFAAAGAVPGYLLNQYALSEWNGSLRVATTSVPSWQADQSSQSNQSSQTKTESTVYVLRPQGAALVETGRVSGLGKGERIYAVRFLGGTGYVVTFRQTDPLYTVDLRDPYAPKVVGELKINGYSAYLHPAGDNRLLGIGQDANAQGQTRGTQVSLFDVADPAKPSRLGQYQLQWAHSEAEFDPHAFLYWPATHLLVVPISAPGGVVATGARPASTPGGTATAVRPNSPAYGALALRVDANGFTELGMVTHPSGGNGYQYNAMIHRSLVIGETLWTVSDAGLAADDAKALTRVAWIPFG